MYWHNMIILIQMLITMQQIDEDNFLTRVIIYNSSILFNRNSDIQNNNKNVY